MKQKLMIALLSILPLISLAKDGCGIYLSLSDFKAGKLTYESDCAANTNKIQLHNFFNDKPDFTVIHKGEKHVYRKDEVYGFRNCRNEVFRFYNNKEYLIAEAGNIYIYSRQENIPQTKGFKFVTKYYFSSVPDGKILPLTISHLKGAYAGNDRFLDLIDQFFVNGDVGEYDNIHKMYKVNYVYAKTMK